MRPTGITRPLDKMGRIVLPVELRRIYELSENDLLEIYVDGENLILHKFQNKCEFCNNTENISKFKGKFVYEDCRKQLMKG